MADPITHAGAIVSISTTAQNSPLGGTSPGFAGLTYTPIANVGNVGEHGYNTNMVNYPTLDTILILKAKGLTDGGTFTIEAADDPSDAGQIAIAAAGDPTVRDSYAFKIEYSNGAIHYLRGPVGGPNHPGGGNEDFVRNVYTVGVNEIERVAP